MTWSSSQRRAGCDHGHWCVLQAVTGLWNATASATVMPPGLDPQQPSKWLVPAADGVSLHWTVVGEPQSLVLPYFEIQEYVWNEALQ